MADHDRDYAPSPSGHYATTNPPMTVSQEQYLARVLQLGALEGSYDDQDLMPELRTVLEAAHHILAGGEVEITVTRRGNPDTVRELSEMRARVVDDNNRTNRALGIHFVGAV